jgi:signal transduction histidine kinase
VKDNGVGISNSQGSEASLGMISMRERARHIGSELTVDSSPQGTQIRFALQLVE